MLRCCARSLRWARYAASVLSCVFVLGCGAGRPAGEPAGPPNNEAGTVATMEVSSPAWDHGEAIPAVYTCDGEDISPPLSWTGAPTGTISYALICDDPDAPVGTWTHWVWFDIPADTTTVDAGLPPGDTAIGGSRQGRNSGKVTGYSGPCPPGGEHRYYVRVYALDTELDLEPGASVKDLRAAMDGHVLASGELMGRYARP